MDDLQASPSWSWGVGAEVVVRPSDMCWNKTGLRPVASGMIHSAVILLLLGAPSPQLPPEQELAVKVNAMDDALFAAFNTCDLATFQSLLDPDVEFFHDKNGLSTGAGTVTAQVESNVCGKVRREVVPGSLEVYPMDGIGALHIGRHRFYNPPTATTSSGEAKFVHLWKNSNGKWQLLRVISFDH